MNILHFEDLGDTSVISGCSLGDNLVIDNFLAPLCHLAAELFKCRLVRRRRRQL